VKLTAADVQALHSEPEFQGNHRKLVPQFVVDVG
jgi:hypothetical protein